MLIVSDIVSDFKNRFLEDTKFSSVYLYDYDDYPGITVIVKDTVTGRTSRLNGSTTSILMKLKERNVYGFYEAQTVDSLNSGIWVVKIDDYSLQFLDYVKSVEPFELVNRYLPSQFIERYKSIYSDAVFVGTCDDLCSLFTVLAPSAHGSSEKCFTLLQLLTGLPDNWIGDSVYLITGRLLRSQKMAGLRGFKVDFEDVAKARVMLGKVALQNMNLVSRFLQDVKM